MARTVPWNPAVRIQSKTPKWVTKESITWILQLSPRICISRNLESEGKMLFNLDNLIWDAGILTVILIDRLNVYPNTQTPKSFTINSAKQQTVKIDYACWSVAAAMQIVNIEKKSVPTWPVSLYKKKPIETSTGRSWTDPFPSVRSIWLE